VHARIYTSEAARHGGQPIHRAIVRRLRSAQLSGATSYRGIWGFHGDRPPHGDRFLQLGRHVPVITTVIDTAERISAAFGIIDELTTERGLVTSEPVLAMRAASEHYQHAGGDLYLSSLRRRQLLISGSHRDRGAFPRA
jgi:PII-like signaling protein